MATTQTKKYAPNEQLPASVAGPIQQSIAKIQAGISSLGGGGSVASPNNYVSTNPRDLPGYVPGTLPGDRPSAQPPQKPQIAPIQLDTQLDPTNQAPQGLVDQTNKVQQGVNTLATQRGTTLQGGSTAIGEQNRAAIDLLKQTGVKPLGTAGADTAAFRTALGNVAQGQQDTSNVENVLQAEPIYADILDKFAEIMSPQAQSQSLVEQYQSLVKSSGLEGINEKLINTFNIIENTESDIRNEITSANGISTNSQVLALSSARNKVLIQNYNALLATRDSIQEQIQTTLQFSREDRQIASQRVSQQLDLAFKIMDYRDKFVRNSRENYNNIIAQVGYNGLLSATNNDPYYINLIERSLGLSAGGLSQLASMPPPPEKSLKLENLRLQNQKLRKEIQGGGNIIIGQPGTPTALINPTTGRPNPRSQIANVISQSGAKTDDKLKLAGAVVSATQSFAENNLQGSIEGLGLGRLIPGRLATQKAQQNRLDLSALEGTVESWMTGASVAEDQADRIKKDMIPKKTDSDGQVKRKINALANYMMSYTAGTLSTQGVNWTPESIDFFSNPVITAPDGQDIEITN